MNVLTYDIQEMLEAESAFNPYGFTVSRGKMIAEPPNVIVLTDMGGYPPGMDLGGANSLSYPSFQVRVRAVDYDEGMVTALSIKNILHGQANFVYNGSFYLLIEAMGDPSFIIVDLQQRSIIGLNFRVQRRNN